MQNRPERDLRNSPIFCSHDKDLWAIRENMPWPEDGDTLLAPRVGSEETIHHPYSWVDSDLEQLSSFAHQYSECARELVREWLRSTAGGPGRVLLVVGFLYRHSVELYLKAIFARSALFQNLSGKEQRKALEGHSLQRLWKQAKPTLADFTDAGELSLVEQRILELDALDKQSDGFRYPFAFVGKDGKREPGLPGLYNSSFVNLVWILDGLTSWLALTEDEEERHSEYIRGIGSGFYG
jgi:hypothetical protein